ncbi:MAG: SAM-dependent methyltransferase [Oscillospiraceae bacterium]|nr:SAM-dependent methyltransferase [Oscillospiraceae bacterium]MDD4368886.1 SAM-dependent methyltransferase [Oscillospiraceae bacterium]
MARQDHEPPHIRRAAAPRHHAAPPNRGRSSDLAPAETVASPAQNQETAGGVRSINLDLDYGQPIYRVALRERELDQSRTRYVLAAIQARQPDFQYRLYSLEELYPEQDLLLPRTLGETARADAELAWFYKALTSGSLDFLVATAPDVSRVSEQQVMIAAVPPRQDARDVLVLAKGRSFTSLGPGSMVGLDSRRRELQLLALKPEIQTQQINGPLPARLTQVQTGQLDALVVAAADLLYGDIQRFRDSLTFQPFSVAALCPEPGQGQLLLICSEGRRDLAKYLYQALDDAPSRACLEAESHAALLLGFGQGRQEDPPAACCATPGKEGLRLTAMNSDAGQSLPRFASQVVSLPGGKLKADPQRVENLVQSLMGQVAFIGAGPGAPDLMTRRGQKLLEAAEVIVYDRLGAASVLPWASPEAEQIFVDPALQSRDSLVDTLLTQARRGKRVVRLCGGDPFLYDDCASEAQSLARAGIAFEVVPGISAITAAPSFAGLPLTEDRRGEPLHIYNGADLPLTAVSEDGSINPYAVMAASAGSTVVLNAIRHLPDITASLLQAGLDPQTPCALIQNGTLTSQRLLRGTLDQIAAMAVENNILPPALLLFGEACRRRGELNWWPPHGVLAGRTCALVMSRDLVRTPAELTPAITREGAAVLELSLVRHYSSKQTERLLDQGLGVALEKRFNAPRRFEKTALWLIMTTADAVHALMSSLKRLGVDLRQLTATSLAVVSPAAEAALLEYGLTADRRPEKADINELANQLVPELGPNDAVVCLHGSAMQSVLGPMLSVAKVPYTDLLAYETETHLPSRRALMKLLDEIDDVIFTSPAAVRSFVEGLRGAGLNGDWLRQQKIAVYPASPAVAEACRLHQIQLAGVPQAYTTADLVTLLKQQARVVRHRNGASAKA